MMCGPTLRCVTFLSLTIDKKVFTKPPLLSKLLLVPLCIPQTFNYIWWAAIKIQFPTVSAGPLLLLCYKRPCIACRLQTSTSQSNTDTLNIFPTLCQSHCSTRSSLKFLSKPLWFTCFCTFSQYLYPLSSFYEVLLSSESPCTSLSQSLSPSFTLVSLSVSWSLSRPRSKYGSLHF